MAEERYVICGVMYAENLGDGVIADCLSHAIGSFKPGAAVEWLDISGRTAFATGALPGKGRMLKVLRRLPAPMARLTAGAALTALLHLRIRKRWLVFRSGDRVLIGGGQLLADHNLNFPLKLDLVSKLAKEKGARISIQSVGVSKEWSQIGARLLRNTVRRAEPQAVTVRDELARESLKAHMGAGAPEIRIALDPGLLAAETYAATKATGRGIGINVSDVEELGTYGRIGLGNAGYIRLVVDTIGRLRAKGLPVTLFTNGALEDDVILRRIEAALDKTDRDIAVVPRPSVPAELVATIKGLDLLVGHRLHAHIVAHAHGIPSLGLGWDSKLASFFAITGRSHHIISIEGIDATAFEAKLFAAREASIDASALAALIGRVTDGVRKTLLVLG